MLDLIAPWIQLMPDSGRLDEFFQSFTLTAMKPAIAEKVFLCRGNGPATAADIFL